MLLLVDGCEDFSSWSVGGSPTIVAGRNGNGFRLSGSSQEVQYNIKTADQTDTVTVGFAWKIDLATVGRAVVLMSDNGATTHGELYANVNGSFTWHRGGGGATPVLTTAAGLFTVNVWAYVELTVKLHDTTGAVTIRVNGVAASITNVDTKNAGTKTVFDQVRLIGFGSGALVVIDDLYLTNDATMYGDSVVQTLYPNGNGNANQWLGSDGNSTDNYLLVDENPVSTADYVGSAVAGQQDLYTFSDLTVPAAGGLVHAVCHQVTAMKTDTGARQLKVVTAGPGSSESITVPGSPNINQTDYEQGVRVQFAVAGRITKIRYKRRADSLGTISLRVWHDSTQAKLAETTDTQTTTGEFTVTLPTPVAVAAGDIRIVSIGGVGSLPNNSVAQTVVNSANVSFLGQKRANTSNNFPNLDYSAAQFNIEPVFESSVTSKSAALDLGTAFAPLHHVQTVDPATGAAWTAANVNALQAGVEVV